MGTIILTIIVIMIVTIFAIKEKDVWLVIWLILVYVMIMSVIFSLCIICRSVKTEYEEKQYNIEGLGNEIGIKSEINGSFVLGFGNVKGKTESVMKYYFFKNNKKGKQLKEIEAKNVYIRETDDENPCYIIEYQEKEFNGFLKFMFGKCTDKEVKSKILVVPTNTIKAEYNIEI